MADNPFDQFDAEAGAGAKTGGNPFDQFDAPPAAAETPDEPSFSELPGQAIAGGVKRLVQAGRQAKQLATGQPVEETAEPTTATEKLANEPFDFTPQMPTGRLAKKVLAKAGVGLVESAPAMAGAIAGGGAGAALSGGNPVAVAGGAGLGAGVVSAAQSLAPIYAEELKKAGDPEAAWESTKRRAAAEGVATGVSFALFEAKPFAGAVKNLLFQTFVAQPAAGAAGQGVKNLEQGAPVTQGMAQAAAEAGVNTAPVVIAGHAAHAIAGKAIPKPFDAIKADADKETADLEAGKPVADEPAEKAFPDVAPEGPAKDELPLSDQPQIRRQLKDEFGFNDHEIDAMSNDDIRQAYIEAKKPEPRLGLPAPSDFHMGDETGAAAPAEPPPGAPEGQRALPPPGPVDAVEAARRARAEMEHGTPEPPLGLPAPADFNLPDESSGSKPPPAPPGPKRLPPPGPVDAVELARRTRAAMDQEPGPTPLDKAASGVAKLNPGDPVTNSVLKNLSGLPVDKVGQLRDELVRRGLIEKKGIHWRRAAADAQDRALNPVQQPEPAPPVEPEPQPSPPEAPAAAPPPSAPPAAATPEAKPEIPGRAIKADTAVTPSGREVPVEYRLVEADDLVASQKDDLSDNPNYPQDLQPRDRTRAASQTQVQSMAGNLNPRLLDQSPKASDGAPIVAKDGVVESGNGRVLAIRRAYEEGSSSSANYHQHLKDQGYPVDGMKKPVLVRVRTSEMSPEDRLAFTRESNERETLSLSATEQALADAKSMSDGVLAQYRGGDVTAAGNRDFVKAFMRDVVSPADQGRMATPDGTLSAEGKRRIEAALAGRAYDDPSLIAAMVEDLDPNIKGLAASLIDISGSWAKMRGDARAGLINPDADMTAQLIEAVRLVRHARDVQQNVWDLVKQTDMLGGGVHPLTEGFLRVFFRDAEYGKPRARDKVTRGLDYLIGEARKTKPEAGLFGAEDVVGPEKLLENTHEFIKRGEATQQDLLAANKGRAKPDGENAAPSPKDRPGGKPALGKGGKKAGKAGGDSGDIQGVAKEGRRPADEEVGGSHDRLPQFEKIRSLLRLGDGPEAQLRAGMLYVRGTSDKIEHGVSFDLATGKTIDAVTSHMENQIKFGSAWLRRAHDPNSALIVQHNHPGNTALSGPDIGLLSAPGMRSIVAHGNKGQTFSAASLTDAARAHLTEKAPRDGQLALQAWYDYAYDDAIKAVDKLIRGGKVARDDADRLQIELTNRALDRAGVTNYLSSLGEFHSLFRSRIEGDLANMASSLRETLRGEGLVTEKRYDEKPYNPAWGIRADEGLARILGEDGSANRGGPDRRLDTVDGRLRETADRSAGEIEGQLRESTRVETKRREETYPTDVQAGLAKWNGARDDRTVQQRVADSIKGATPGLFDRAYQAAVDRRFAFWRNENTRVKRGDFAAGDITKDGDVHARLSAHKSAMFYDREASLSEQALVQGAPQYDGMGVKVDRSGGLLDVLRPIGKAGLWREFAAYQRIIRAERLAGEGRDKQFSPDDLKTKAYLEQKYPFFKDVQAKAQAFNKKVMQLAVDSGRLTQERADFFTKEADYTAFYRKLLDDSGSKVGGPLHVDSLTNDSSFRRLKGGDAQIGEYLENTTRNLRAVIASSMKNIAAQMALRDAEAIGIAERVKGNPVQLEHARDVVRVYENGAAAYYRVHDALTLSALHGLDGAPLNGFLRALGLPARTLRFLTTHTPTFLLVNHPMRESMQAWLVSRENVAPIMSALKGQLEVFRNGDLVKDLRAKGIGGGFDLAGGEGRAERMIRKFYAGEKGGVLGAMHTAYERLIDSADLGVRTQVYQKELARLGGKPGDEYEAAIASTKQGVNFKQRGASEAMRWATIAIPFLNARIQGLDTLGRAFRDRPKQTFMKAALMMALSSAYYAWVKSNPLYQKADDQLKDDNFLLPMGDDHLFRLPAPFEAGILFKRVPERMWRAIDGSDLPKDTKAALGRAILDTLHFDFLPQAVKPAVEVAANHSFFTGREVVSPRLQGLPVEQRSTEKTSELAKGIGHVTGTAPVNVDQLLRGYFGTMGGYALAATDALTHAAKGGPAKPAGDASDIPGVGSLIKSAHTVGDEAQTRFYELKRDVDELVKGVNNLKQTDPAAAAKFANDNKTTLQAQGYTNATAKQLANLRRMETQIKASPSITPEEKRAKLDALETTRRQTLQKVDEMRRRAAGG